MDSSPVLFDYPNARANVFIMMSFKKTKKHIMILDSIRKALSNYGINGLRADDKSYANSIWGNVKSYMDACNYGIAIFEESGDNYFNPNVSIEMGYMIAQNKPVLILKEDLLESMPTDIVGKLYKSFDSNNITETIKNRINEWLIDVRIAKSGAEKLVLFVSSAGTCRCAMAKVALERALDNIQLPYKLRVMSIAYDLGTRNDASPVARKSVYSEYNHDYLEEHRVTARNKGLLDDADLILVMGEEMKKGLPKHKTQTFHQFFNLNKAVENPWLNGYDPWNKDDEKLLLPRYKQCCKDFKNTFADQNKLYRLINQLNHEV